MDGSRVWVGATHVLRCFGVIEFVRSLGTYQVSYDYYLYPEYLRVLTKLSGVVLGVFTTHRRQYCCCYRRIAVGRRHVATLSISNNVLDIAK